MRASIALFVAGEVLTLAGIAMWSIPLALVLAGLQCGALALFREQQAQRPTRNKGFKPGHRRQSVRTLVSRVRSRKLRLVKAAS